MTYVISHEFVFVPFICSAAALWFSTLLVLMLLLVLAKKSQLMYHLHAQLRGMDRRQFI